LLRFTICAGAKKNFGFGPGSASFLRSADPCVAPIVQSSSSSSPK